MRGCLAVLGLQWEVTAGGPVHLAVAREATEGKGWGPGTPLRAHPRPDLLPKRQASGGLRSHSSSTLPTLQVLTL